MSVAAYLRQPSANDALGDTKVTFNAGKGIKEPSLGQELSSLFALVPAATRRRSALEPIGPERSRNVDVGVEQGLAGGRGRVRVAYFDNAFDDLIEFVNKGVLPQLGVPPAAAAAASFGAYVNSQSNTSRGVELSGEARSARSEPSASYMLPRRRGDEVVQQRRADARRSTPRFPAIKIGQYAPLVGNRPFRRPANSGSLVVSYADRKAQVVARRLFRRQAGRQHASERSDSSATRCCCRTRIWIRRIRSSTCSGSYQVHPRLRAYVVLENAFDAKFAAVAGFPALPRAVRAGVTVRVGGD